MATEETLPPLMDPAHARETKVNICIVLNRPHDDASVLRCVCESRPGGLMKLRSPGEAARGVGLIKEYLQMIFLHRVQSL